MDSAKRKEPGMDSPTILEKTEYERLRSEWRRKSDEAFARMFAADQQEQLITFTQREDRAVELGRALAAWLIEEHAAGDVATQPSEHQQVPHCAKCGREAVRRTKPEDPLPERRLVTRAGPVELEREQWECTTCRVVFFPLGPEAGTGGRRV